MRDNIRPKSFIKFNMKYKTYCDIMNMVMLSINNKVFLLTSGYTGSLTHIAKFIFKFSINLFCDIVRYYGFNIKLKLGFNKDNKVML